VTLAFALRARCGAARAGTLTVRGRALATPAFLPVGTYGSVKGVPPATLRAIGAGMLLANAAHLHDRPGADVVGDLGGLHALMNWDGPILTDSGGFQVFSMLDVARLDDDGVTVRSPVDGRALRLGPETMVEVQARLDADVAMTFDHCPPLPAGRPLLATSVRRTIAWARRAREHHLRAGACGQAQLAIVQGGLDDRLRAECAEALVAMDFPGYAIGGLSVGEKTADLHGAMARYAPLLPAGRPRYLMGVGHPRDVLAAIDAGFDLFDCVLPSRNGRHGTILTEAGWMHLRNSRFRRDTAPLEEGCDCPTCREGWSRGALRHLVMAGEPLGRSLGTIHNLRVLHRLVETARAAILAGDWPRVRDELRARSAVLRAPGPGPAQA